MDECFMEAVSDKRKAVAISRSHAMNNPFGLIEGIGFSCFPAENNLVIYSVVMLFRKFHHLLPMIDENIRVILESGLLTKWEMDSNKKAASVSTGHEGEPQIKLAVEHVEGAFFTIIVGLSLCLLVFIIECVVHHMVKAKICEKFMKKVEKLLCYA
jgi:hypothetical protein